MWDLNPWASNWETGTLPLGYLKRWEIHKHEKQFLLNIWISMFCFLLVRAQKRKQLNLQNNFYSNNDKIDCLLISGFWQITFLFFVITTTSFIRVLDYWLSRVVLVFCININVYFKGNSHHSCFFWFCE